VSDINITLQGSEMLISGKLTHETVMFALAKSETLMPSNKAIDVNLQAVSRCDSASLAFLTALMRLSQSKRTRLNFIHVPSQMLQIGRVSGLDNLLPIAQR
jgi:phospholipid transport system transporter-binding protein